MPTARGTLSLAVINDTFYAVGGAENLVDPHAPAISVNEQYFPLGYLEPTPSPSVPEFPTWIAISALASTAFLLVIAIKRKHS
jgi:hypothetical protein